MCSETLIQNTTNDAKLKAALGRANLTPFDSIDPRVLLSSEDLAAEVAAAAAPELRRAGIRRCDLHPLAGF